MEIDMLLDDFPNRLVGKFFTNSTPPSLEDTETSLRQQWAQIVPENMNMNMTLLNDRFCFLFDFKEKEDKELVLSNGAWVVNGVMLVIKKFTYDVNVIIDFTVTDLWVQVEGIPFYFFTEQVFSYIQTLLSDKPIKPLPLVAEAKAKDGFLYFQTEIDLKKPLNPGFYLAENRFVEFTYKNIGDFCYNCGMIGHLKSGCTCHQVPNERSLNATMSKTPLYGPWLRLDSSQDCYEVHLKLGHEEKDEVVKECEKTLPYPQFFIQLKFNAKLVCNSHSKLFPLVTHNFRIPCSYLDSTDLASSKAREVIANEISENAGLSHKVFEDLPVKRLIKEINGEKLKVICSLLEYLNVIRKTSEDKWLPLKLEINLIFTKTPVYYQRIVNELEDWHCVGEIETKISELIKQKVEKKENLFCLSLWESDIKKALVEIGYGDYPYLFDISTKAQQAMERASEMATTCPIPAERQSVEKLERRKVIGSEIDSLDPCMICSEEIFLAEEVTVLPCSHVFHSLCVHKWFQVGHKCPLCGFKLPCNQE